MASLIPAILHVTLVAPFVLLAVVVLQECEGCAIQECTRIVAPVWQSIRQFSLRSIFILTALASIGSMVLAKVRLRVTFRAIEETVEGLFCLSVFSAAVLLFVLLMEDLSIALGIIPRYPAHYRMR